MNILNHVKSTHNLNFETSYSSKLTPDWKPFKIGTCMGFYKVEGNAYEIKGLVNFAAGNGHLTDVFEWFEHSCKRDKKKLRFVELQNADFAKILCQRLGFTQTGSKRFEREFK